MRNSLYSVTLDEAFSSVSGRRTYDLLLSLTSFLLFLSAGFSLSTLTSSGLPSHLLPQTYLISAALGPSLLSLLERYTSRRKSLIITAIFGVADGVMFAISKHIVLIVSTVAVKGAVDSYSCILATLAVIENTDGMYRNWLVGGAVAGGYLGYGLGIITAGYIRGGEIGLRFSGLILAVLWLLCARAAAKLRESPRYLAVMKGKYELARSELRTIAGVNHRPPFNDVLEGEKVIGFQECPKDGPDSLPNQTCLPDFTGKLVFFPIGKGIVTVSQGDILHVRRFYLWNILTLRSLRGLFVISILTVCSVLFLLRNIGNVPGDNLQWVQSAMWAGDTLAVLLAASLVNATGRLGMSVVLLAGGGLSGVLSAVTGMLVCHSAGLCFLQNLLKGVLAHSARAFAEVELFVLTLFLCESYPTAVRLMAVSAILGTAVGFWIICGDVVNAIPGNVMLFSGGGLIGTAILSCVLADTSGEELPDYVLEEKEDMQRQVDLSQVDIPPAATEESARSAQPVN